MSCAIETTANGALMAQVSAPLLSLRQSKNQWRIARAITVFPTAHQRRNQQRKGSQTTPVGTVARPAPRQKTAPLKISRPRHAVGTDQHTELGISQPQLAHALARRFGLSPAVADRLQEWLRRPAA